MFSKGCMLALSKVYLVEVLCYSGSNLKARITHFVKWRGNQVSTNNYVGVLITPYWVVCVIKFCFAVSNVNLMKFVFNGGCALHEKNL